MKDRQEPTSKDQGTPFDVSSCEEMMETMMSQDWEGCDCGEVMSQVMDQGEIPEEWLGMMSRMMEMCCGVPGADSIHETTNVEE